MIFYVFSESEKELLDGQKQPLDGEKQAFKVGVCRKETGSLLTGKSEFSAGKLIIGPILSDIFIILGVVFSRLRLFVSTFLGNISL